jgi:glutamyl-Q tRNA(Asp) synthetase
MHLPVALNEAGEKLSKQTLATPVDVSQPVSTLLRVLDFLKQQPPANLADSDVATVLGWAVMNWDISRLRGLQTQAASPFY